MRARPAGRGRAAPDARLRKRPLRRLADRANVADVRRVVWVLAGLCGGCWRDNPAFSVEWPVASTGAVSSTGGPDGGSSGPDMPPGTDTTAGETTAGETTAEPGTTAIEPGTTGGETTTGEPGTGGSTTGSIDEATLCAQALAGELDVIPIHPLGLTMCDATWRSSDQLDPNSPVTLPCPSASEQGIIETKDVVLVSPDNEPFPGAMLTGPRKSPTGTIEGLYPPTPLGFTEHPCLLTRLGCPSALPSCSLKVQISVKTTAQPDFDEPQLTVFVDETGPVDVALPLTEFKGADVDILLLAVNDGEGAGNQEGVAWLVPIVVDVSP